MSSYGYSNPNQSSVPASSEEPSVPASSQQNVARVVAPQPVQSEPMDFTDPPGSTAPPQDAEEIETGPFSFRRYYPLFNTIQGAVDASPTPSKVRPGENTVGYHSHSFDNGRITYYMPNGLEMGVNQFHGDFSVEKMLLGRVTTVDDSLSHKKFILRHPSGSYVIYQRGDVVSYQGNLYEVMVRTFGMLPDIDNTIFRKINEKTDISIIDGGEF